MVTVRYTTCVSPSVSMVMVTTYSPTSVKTCVGFNSVDVLSVPDAGSPKSQVMPSMTVEVLMLNSVVSPKHVYLKTLVAKK